MKANAFRIIFFTIVIVLIILAVYIVYRDKKTEILLDNQAREKLDESSLGFFERA